MINDLTRHSIYVDRYAGGINRKLLTILRSVRDEISGRISTASEFETARLTILLADINKIIDTAINEKYSPTLFDELNSFAQYEQDFTIGMLGKNTTSATVIAAGIPTAQLEATIASTAMHLHSTAGKVQSLTPKQMVGVFSDRMQKDIETIIRTGFIAGDTTEKIARSIQRLSNSRTKAQAEAVVRTITGHYSEVAREQVWKQNSDLFQGEEFTAVLDGRTTLQCAVRDGGIWTMDGRPLNAIARKSAYLRPKLHYSCRSVMVPKIKPEYDLKIDTTRASSDGPVSSNLTYSGWLRKQPEEVQNEVLGISRAKLFRSGKLTLDKFMDDSGKVYTLEKLKQLDLLK